MIASTLGPDTNGSLFQVCFTQNPDLDGSNVVFGCLASTDSYQCLENINMFGTAHGEPLEELRIVDCGVAYPDPKIPKEPSAVTAIPRKMH